MIDAHAAATSVAKLNRGIKAEAAGSRVGGWVAIVLCLVASAASAHHGFAVHYDPDQTIILEGSVTRLEFVNPHSFVYIETVDDAGKTIEHWCEMQGRSMLERKGVTVASFAVGSRIYVRGFQARRDPLGCEFGAGVLPDGTELLLRTETGATQYPAVTVESDDGVFGTWRRKTFPGSMTRPAFEEHFTETARAKTEGYDALVDNPIYSCRSTGAMHSWLMPGLLSSVERVGDDIVIRNEFMDTVRVVHMSVDDVPEGIARSELGYSIGRFDGDNLIIESSNFLEGFTHSAILHSEEFELTERLSIDRETGDLLVTFTIRDPVYYTETLDSTLTMLRTQGEIRPYNCVPEVGHGLQNG